jgi:hypothetical protein
VRVYKRPVLLDRQLNRSTTRERRLELVVACRHRGHGGVNTKAVTCTRLTRDSGTGHSNSTSISACASRCEPGVDDWPGGSCEQTRLLPARPSTVPSKKKTTSTYSMLYVQIRVALQTRAYSFRHSPTGCKASANRRQRFLSVMER